MRAILFGILNAFLPGAAYLFLRRRQVFGTFILVSGIAYLASGFFEPETGSFFFATTQEGKIFEAIALVTGMFAFGYDAYSLAKEN